MSYLNRAAPQQRFDATKNYAAGTVGAQLRDVAIDARSFPWLAKGDGSAGDGARVRAALAALIAGGGGTLVLANGVYSIESSGGDATWADGLMVPFQSSNGTASRVKIKGCGRSTVLSAANDGMCVVRYSDSNCSLEDLVIDANGHANVVGLGVLPQNVAQTVTLVNQSFNRFSGLFIKGCAEGIVLQAGPKVGGADSGCWYNEFLGVHVFGCARAVWMREPPTAASSGVNRNTFINCRFGQGSNTGLQIDAGDSNQFFGSHFEGINQGVYPSATPTGVKIANAGVNAAANEGNRFFGCQFESCTRDVENANAYSEFFGCNVLKALWTALPQVLLGGYDPSAVPQIALGAIFQADALVPGVENLAHHLKYGRIQFQSVALPSTDKNTLDCYDEATWTPTVLAAAISGVGYAEREGYRVKIGRHVFFRCRVRLNALIDGGTNYLRVDGLPEPALTDTAVSVTWGGLTGAAAGVIPSAKIVAGNGAINLYDLDGNGETSGTGMSGQRLTAAAWFDIAGWYVTAT